MKGRWYLALLFTKPWPSFWPICLTQDYMWLEKDGRFLNKDIESAKSPGLNWEGTQYMGYLDFCFLIAYSVGLFISGNLGDRYPVRVIVPTGFFIISIMTFMFAMGGSWGISSYWYYMAFFTMSGFFQSIGWPAFVPVMANWFSKKYRGLVLGIWCTCQNFGNIGGALLVNILRGYFGMNWILCFKVIAVIILILGFLNLFFLIGEPSNVGIDIDTTEELNSSNHNIDVKNNIDEEERISLDKNSEADPQEDVKADQHLQPIDKIDSSSRKMSEKVQEPKVGQRAISFWKAWTIPKVIPYAICLALVKLSTYGILLWLPVYADEALHYNNAAIGYLAVTYDIGTIVGSVVLGKISDIVYHKRSPVAFFGCLSGAIFFILVILTPGYINIIIFFVGFFVGGVFNVVAATAATDIAKSNAMDPKDKALSTISGINDGWGSIGSAFGSLIISSIRGLSWNGVFIFLASCVLIASLPILRVVINEVKEIIQIRKEKKEVK